MLVTHDRYMLDRVSSIVLGLDWQSSAESFADYSGSVAGREERASEDRSLQRKPTLRRNECAISGEEEAVVVPVLFEPRKTWPRRAPQETRPSPEILRSPVTGSLRASARRGTRLRRSLMVYLCGLSSNRKKG